MAPITTTTAGVARQIIDDPELISLLERLHAFTVPEGIMGGLDGAGGYGDATMRDDSEMEVMIDGLVKELEGVQRWQFQEQADLYEWIKPLNTIDATLRYFIEAYPSLLLIPPQHPVMSEAENNQPRPTDNTHDQEVPSKVTSQLTTILIFLSTLLRNSINKSIFYSVHELSSLLTCKDDNLSHLALKCLSTLSQPPLLHRQQAPEMGGHSTQLNILTDGGRIMQRILGCGVGWGSKESNLGLLNCIEMDDADLTSIREYGEAAGSVLFETCVENEGVNLLVEVEVGWDDMYNKEEGRMEQEGPTEKKRKVVPSSESSPAATVTDTPARLKSTTQLFNECLASIHQQLNPSGETNNAISLPAEKQFTLLSNIRLARYFHTTSTRISAIEYRLRAIICLLSSQPNQDTIGAFFAAQPELCGEMVDLIRPTVSGGNMTTAQGDKHESLMMLSNSPQVPFHIRTLAIEALTALVARRDSTGMTNNVARQVNVLSELGVGKAQYSGLLPTLIRYSLAALNSFLLTDAHGVIGKSEEGANNEMDLGQELGMIFLRCTKAPELPQKDHEERALELIDAVLTLTSAVISVPSGTAALTDCGIIPALVSTIALDSQIVQKRATGNVASSLFATDNDGEKESYSECLLKYITAQAIQILEGAIVTHNSALSAFHELKGVDILVQRLSLEMQRVKHVKTNDGNMAKDGGDDKPRRNLLAARRVLLFSAVNCLTVVFHQQEASGSNANIPSGAAQLRKPELMDVLSEILDNADSYGGVMAGLVSTLLSDVINSDPQVVHHVHKSGLGKLFLSLLMGKNDEMKQVIGSDVEKWGQIEMEPSSELIMAFPNLILALSLTENGARAIKELNPFPALLSVFCSPKFAMPNSRCLLSEMAAIIGTGLDEIMRHNPINLKPLVMKAIVQVMNRIVYIGKQLVSKEEQHDESDCSEDELILERTYLVQYSHNVRQMLEQILHNEEHIPLFLTEGGFDALLELVRWSITPAGYQFIAHITCLSSPSIGSVTHTSISTSFGAIVKIIASHSDSYKITKKIMDALEFQFTDLRKCIARFRDGVATGTAVMNDESEGEFSLSNILKCIPTVPFYDLQESKQNTVFLDSLASLYRSIIVIDWLVQSLASTIRAVNQRMSDNGMGAILFGRQEKEFQKELASESFRYIMYQLCILHRSALWEVCRARTEPGFDDRDLARNEPCSQPLVYRIRIVCQEGAICRNGIDIDGCDNIGNVEMGEIIEAYDRCINSSGVLRYKTGRGWVSELTRGHGRENIAEVIDVRKGSSGAPITFNATKAQRDLKRIECGVPDLCSVSASIFARLHISHSELFSSFQRIIISRLKSARDPFPSAAFPPYISSVSRILSKGLQDDCTFVDGKSVDTQESHELPNLSFDASKCMYYGSVLNLLYNCLYSEKRVDRRGSLNIPLLLSLLTKEGWEDGIYPPNENSEEKPGSSEKTYAFLLAILFVLKHSLRDMAIHSVKKKAQKEEQHAKINDIEKPQLSHRRLSKAVASSFPPTLSLLQRLMSRQMLTESPVCLSLAKMKSSHLKALISDDIDLLSNRSPSYNPGQFARGLHIEVAKLSFQIFSDHRLCCAPAHILHPWIRYINTILSSLEDAAKRTPVVASSLSNSATSRSRGGGTGGQNRLMNDLLGSLSVEQLFGAGHGGLPNRLSQQLAEPFEPSEESIERLIEMGFTRDHAIESLETVGSNRVDVAMEYALSNPPSSPATLERRRAAREERRRRRQELAAAPSPRVDETASNSQSQNMQASSSELNNVDRSSTNSGDAAVAMPSSESNDQQKDDGQNEEEELSKEELKTKRDEEFEEKDAERAKEYLISVKDEIFDVCLNIIESGSAAVKFENEMESVGNLDDGSGAVDTDAGNVTVVVASFLVDLCSRFSNDSTKISTALIRRLKSNLRIKSRSHCQVKQGCEVNFSSLAHASVVFFRSVPKSRSLILKHGVVSCLLHCVRNVTLSSSFQNGDGDTWPCWLAPSLLLLELMAQPTSVHLDDEKDADNETGAKAGKKGDFAKVMSEHKKQTTALAKHAKHVFTALNKDLSSNSHKKKKEKGPESTKSQRMAQPGDSSTLTKDIAHKKEAHQNTSIPQLPTMLPLIHSEDAEASMRLCLQLLGLRSARKVLNSEQLEKACPPPNIVHAALSLLIRVLNCQKIASLCLNLGGAGVILSLPDSCYFTGNVGLVTLALRRMLEDDATLQAMMETEIRSQVAKLFKKQHRGSVYSEHQPKASLKPFMQAITPLIRRSPIIAVRAIACSVKLQPKGDQSSSLSSSRDSRVVLLTAEERAKTSKLVGSLGSNKDTGLASTAALPNKKTPSKYQEDQSSRLRGRSKSPHHSKRDKSDPKKSAIEGTPQNHIISLLLDRVVHPAEHQLDTKRPFLRINDYLDVLSDLVLAIPSCGAAIHRYKPPTDMHIHHALPGCVDPPQTALSCLIHKLVTLPRTKKSDDKIETVTPERKIAIMKAKISQASARLIVSLVARSGEGRRRVISDLVFAISCGRINNQHLLDASAHSHAETTAADEDYQMRAIETWAELMLGMCAPRSSAKASSTSNDSNSSLSFEVVKVMLDQGAAHALIFAIERIDLSRPSAGSVAASLLRPLEILTRSTVYNKVSEMAQKDKDKKKSGTDESKESRRMTFGPSSRSESAFADDEMLEEGFDGSSRRMIDEDIANDIVVGGELEMDEDDFDEGSHSESDSEDMEVRLGQVDFSDEDEEVLSEDAESDSSDIEEESQDSDEDDNSESEPSSEDVSEGQDDDDENEEENFLDGTEQEVDEAGWAHREEIFGGDLGENDFSEASEPEDEPDVGEEMTTGGWQAVGDNGNEGSGFISRGLANMLMGALARPGAGVRGRGLGDEAGLADMLGSFLREGRMQELEDTLGIRVVQRGGGGGDRENSGGRMGVRVFSGGPVSQGYLSAHENPESSAAHNSVVFVNQTIAPENGFSAPSMSNRSLAEAMPMEYIYGGPADGVRSEYYYSRRSSGGGRESSDVNMTSPGNTSELFPGGLAASTHSRQAIAPHPLLASVDLPPVNALLANSAQPAIEFGGNNSSRSFSNSGTFVRTQAGVMRLSRGPHRIDPITGRSTMSSSLSYGWVDDALPFENEADDFGSLFGQALIDTNQAILDDVTARNDAAASEEPTITAALQDVDADNAEDPISSETEDTPANETADTEPEVSNDSGENVDVSRLSISQTHASNDQPESHNDRNDATEQNDAEMEDAEEQPDLDRMGDAQGESGQEAQMQYAENEVQDEEDTAEDPAEDENVGGNTEDDHTEPGEHALTCPPDVDPEVFNSLPLEMQAEICREAASTTDIAAQIPESSGLDPEALAALPEEMRQEIIEQERQQQHRRQQENEAAADPNNAEEMDGANFLASLTPELREEVLLTSDQAFLETLPPQILAEANVLRERAAAQHRRQAESHAQSNALNAASSGGARAAAPAPVDTNAPRRSKRSGKLKVETDRANLVYAPETIESIPLLTGDSIKAMFRLFYLLSPIQKHRIIQKLLLNLCRHPGSRQACIDLLIALLNDDKTGVVRVVEMMESNVTSKKDDDFPPTHLIGLSPELVDNTSDRNAGLLRNEALSASVAASSIPSSIRGLSTKIPPIVARRMLTILSNLTKSSPRICISMIENGDGSVSRLDRLLDMFRMSLYTRSAKNLELLLTVLETLVNPLSVLPKEETNEQEADPRTTPGIEFVKVPRVVVSRERLHLLVSALRLESCSDASFNKVNVISRRLSRVEANRDCILGELASVAQGLGKSAIRDLKSVNVRLSSATNIQGQESKSEPPSTNEMPISENKDLAVGTPSSAVSLSTSNSELKFVRVLQTIQSLCSEIEENNAGGGTNSTEFALLVQSLDLEPLWKELDACLHLVSVLEGVDKHQHVDENEEQGDDLEGDDPMKESSDKKLQNSVAGLITRFLPAIEAFFIVNANSTSEEDDSGDDSNARLVQFASSNKVLLNALLRSNPNLLEKGLKAMVRIPKCRPFLDFDVKRQWFKTQVRRLRQQASRRHGSLRLNLRRRHVFEDSFRAFIHRNADELRGRLHITFQNEEGVDAGGLSREFFAILAKEMFNPNYALFMSTEDGCTFQPNPNSSINLDDHNYFRFVGRIVGKAVTDGFLLDAHFTRSLYKHMLGIKPTHHDMQAIDPDYYKNLQLILEHKLEDIGVELTFSTEDHSFGRSQVIDLVPNGRNINVTDETKAKYVDLVCQHRMTTAIEKQIQAFLKGFHEMVDKDLISIFTAKELELLISGMPDIDIHDLKKNTDYNGYKPADKEIGWFWNIMFNLSRSEKAAFLQFVTGSSKVPLAGFSELQGMRGVQKFSINKASGSAGALMSAHTCFNALDLPEYKSEEEMKEKLIYAISEGSGGFGFA